MKSLGREGISWRESSGRKGERREGERRDRGECELGNGNSSGIGSVRRWRRVGEWRVGVERKRCGVKRRIRHEVITCHSEDGRMRYIMSKKGRHGIGREKNIVTMMMVMGK